MARYSLDFKPTRQFAFEVKRGLHPGWSTIEKFGQDPSIATSNFVWDGSAAWEATTSAQVYNISSGSAEDTNGGGTGMRTVRVIGLNGSFVEQEEDITLNGATTAATTKTYARIHRMYGLTFGSGQTNAGAISAVGATDSSTIAQITAGEGQTLMAIYTIPASKRGYLCCVWANLVGISANVAAGLKLQIRYNADTATAGWRTFWTGALAQTGSGNIDREYQTAPIIDGPADVAVVVTDATGTPAVSAGFDFLLGPA